MNTDLLIVVMLIATAILFVIAELFGRAKHIGRWWSFFLMWGCFILPGIIAILLSPSAKKEPTKANKFVLVLGFVIIILGLLMLPGLITLSHTISTYEETGFTSDNPYLISALTERRFLISQIGALVIFGIYLTQLGSGNVKNNKPKYYFPEFNFSVDLSTIKHYFSNSISSGSNKDAFYYIVENGQQSEPYTFEQLKGLKLKEEDMVWRKGLEKWVQAKELYELRNIILYAPPPIQSDSNDEVKVEASHVIIQEIVSDGMQEKPLTQPQVNEEKIVSIQDNALKESEENGNNGEHNILHLFLMLVGVIVFFLIIGFLYDNENIDISNADNTNISSKKEKEIDNQDLVNNSEIDTLAAIQSSLPENYFLEDDQSLIYYYDPVEKYWWMRRVFVNEPINKQCDFGKLNNNDKSKMAIDEYLEQTKNWYVMDGLDTVEELNNKYKREGRAYERKYKKIDKNFMKRMDKELDRIIDKEIGEKNN